MARPHHLGVPLVGVTLLVAACGAAADAPADPPVASAPTEDDDGDAPDTPVAFDREAARARAEDLLERPEDEVAESGDLRVVRRGDERRAVTMDLRPGRSNVELDQVGGRFVVTRVTVEVPDGQDPLVVETPDAQEPAFLL